MEFPEVGEQCRVSSCRQLDFLPIKCQFCGDKFCQQHFLPQHHSCLGNYDVIKEKECGKRDHSYPCELRECTGGELAPIICPACSKNFCLMHRHQVDHSCPHYQPPTNPMAEAGVKLQKITSQLEAASSKKGQGRKSDKLAAKVQLMKLKQHASGDSGLPQEERLYFLVLLPKSSSSSSLAVFVSHHSSVGRAIDAIAALAKVSNRNNVTGADKLILFRTSDGSRVAPLDKILSTLLDDHELYNGQTLILEYVAQDTAVLAGFKDYKA